MTRRGAFIVIEGGDGAGKDTQIDLLTKVLPPERFLFTREPGGTPVGQKLRAILLEGREAISDETEALLFLADRAEHMNTIVRPAIEKGTNVISNRSWLSLIAYQIYGRGRLDMLPLVNAAHDLIYRNTRPDLIIYLDIPPEAGILRTHHRGHKDAMEREQLAFHDRVHSGFAAELKKEPNAVMLDATKPPGDLHKKILERIQSLSGV